MYSRVLQSLCKVLHILYLHFSALLDLYRFTIHSSWPEDLFSAERSTCKNVCKKKQTAVSCYCEIWKWMFAFGFQLHSVMLHIVFPSRKILVEAPKSINLNAGSISLDLKQIMLFWFILKKFFHWHSYNIFCGELEMWANNKGCRVDKINYRKKVNRKRLCHWKTVSLRCLLTSGCCLWRGGMMAGGSLEGKETRKISSF